MNGSLLLSYRHLRHDQVEDRIDVQTFDHETPPQKVTFEIMLDFRSHSACGGISVVSLSLFRQSYHIDLLR